MKRVEQAVRAIRDAITDRDILEVACGCAEFSCEAAKYARTVRCIDLDADRLPSDLHTYPNLIFAQMDASALDFTAKTFDTVVLYNAIGHLSDIVTPVIAEALRVTRPGGTVHIISSSKLDRRTIDSELCPTLRSMQVDFTMTADKIFTYITIPR